MSELKNIYDCFMPTKIKTKFKLDDMVRYWFNWLFSKTLNIFEWSGLPFEQRELERLLLLKGSAAIATAQHANGDQFIGVFPAAPYGVTEYPDKFTHLTITAPTVKSVRKEIDKNAVFARNTDNCCQIAPLTNYYALLITHAFLTLKCELVNERYSEIFLAATEAQKETVDEWRDNIEAGDYYTILDDLYGNVAGQPLSFKPARPSHITDFADVSSTLIKQYFNDIGVNYSLDKKERMITEEVGANNQYLLVNIDDMLKSRKKAAVQIRDVLGLDVSVRINPVYDVQTFKAESQEVAVNESEGEMARTGSTSE